MKLEALRQRFRPRPPADDSAPMTERVKAAVGFPGSAPANFDACERCGSKEDVRWESARTAYEPTVYDPEPNRPQALCRPCAKEHHEHWDEMWDQYKAALL